MRAAPRRTRGSGSSSAAFDRLDAQSLVPKPAARPRRPRARRSWTDRQAARPGARLTPPAPVGPGRPRPTRARSARDARATGRSPGRIEPDPARALPRGSRDRRACAPASRCAAAAPGRRRGFPIRAAAPPAAETPRPAPSRHIGFRASACGSSHAWSSGTSRRNLAAATAGSRAPSRAPDGRAAHRSEAASRQAARSCRPRSGPGPESTSCQPPSAILQRDQGPGFALDLVRECLVLSISHQA